MPTILVLRHSIAVANEEHIMAGASLDSPLSENGRRLAIQKGRGLKLQGFLPDAIYTSPLRRTIDTARIIVAELAQTGLPATSQRLSGLNERSFGDYEGTTYQETIAAFERLGNNPPSVEPTDAVVRRVIETFEAIKRKTNGTTLVVTHSAPIMILQAYLFRPDMLDHFWDIGDPANCEGFTYEY